MLDDEQKQQLEKLSKAVLVDFVSGIQGTDKLLDKKIERLLLQSDKPKLIKKLTSTLKGLKRRRKELPFWEYNDFVTELQYLIDDIMSLYPEQPEACLELLELFIATTDTSLQRVDDTKGEVGDIYRRLTLNWLQVAAICCDVQKQGAARDEQDIISQAWIEKVKAMVDDNDYGTKDNLLCNVNLLLSAAEIQSLIDDYKYEYETLLTDSFSGYTPLAESTTPNNEPMNANTFEKRRIETVLTDLAWALGDIKTFEDIYLYLNAHRTFSLYEFDKLMRFMLEHDAFDVALQYLDTDDDTNSLDEVTRLDWLSEIYQQQKNTKAQLEVLTAAFAFDPTPTRYKQIMAIATPAEQARLRKTIYQLADQQENVMTTVDLWLEIEETERANQAAIDRQDEFDDIHYTTLTRWIKQLPDEAYLIRVLVYRSLLNDILDSANTIAYNHAARYYKHLVKLDTFIARSASQYMGLGTHQRYTETLRKTHGKKYSFWERVEI